MTDDLSCHDNINGNPACKLLVLVTLVRITGRKIGEKRHSVE
jgi:hypothetical protein